LTIGATILILVIKFIFILKRFIAAFFVYLLFKPIRFVLRFIFYKAIVKFYSFYLTLAKRFGWEGKKIDFFSFLFNQKLVHIFVIIIVSLLLFINLTAKTKAGDLTEGAHKTILVSLIKSEFGNLEDSEQLIVETFDKEATISVNQATYLDNLTAMKPQPRVDMEADEGDEIMPTIQGGSSLVKPDIALTKISKRPREEVVIYKVKPGDTVSTIAEEFEISVSTILWENDLSAYSIIRPGDELDILPMSGVRHEVAGGENLGSIAKKYDVSEEEILTTNKLTDASSLQIGQKLIIPGGQKTTYTQYTTARYTGISALRDIVKAPDATPANGNKMNWPTIGSKITQYYSWRHHAIDIADKVGTPIYAADAGTIEYIGWGTGYGNQIVIDHGGGKKTRYAHLSKFFVEQGQKVSKGQTIASMGSTGWSTGPHLHFEVIINGVKYNPLNYIK
jgi:murein DD-endopeptidase MepM/ murein hydrolase activator NlpD